jgi:hypothetical protein
MPYTATMTPRPYTATPVTPLIPPYVTRFARLYRQMSRDFFLIPPNDTPRTKQSRVSWNADRKLQRLLPIVNGQRSVL